MILGGTSDGRVKRRASTPMSCWSSRTAGSPTSARATRSPRGTRGWKSPPSATGSSCPASSRRGDYLLPVLEPVPWQRPVPARPRHRSGAPRQALVRHRCRRRQPLLHAQRSGRGLQDRHDEQRHAQRSAEAERNKLSSYRGFWSITLGGAEGLYIDDLVGNFDPGKEADFVVLDCNGGPPALAWRQSLIAEDGKLSTLEQAADLLFGVMAVGDDRAIEQTWAMGTQVYQRR